MVNVGCMVEDPRKTLPEVLQNITPSSDSKGTITDVQFLCDLRFVLLRKAIITNTSAGFREYCVQAFKVWSLAQTLTVPDSCRECVH